MDFRDIDLNLLILLDALFDAPSATAVAQRLKISQPTVSFSLKKLRGVFDDPLFVRTGTGLRPTPFALTLRAPIREALNVIRTQVLPSRSFVPAASTREFRVSTSDVGELCFMSGLLAALRDKAPHATLSSISLPHGALAQALESGSVDLAIGYFPDLHAPEFLSDMLFNHPFVIIARRDHPLTHAPMTIEAFTAAEHAAVAPQGRSQEIFERTLANQGLKRNIVLTTSHFMVLPSLIASTNLIAIAPRILGAMYQASAQLEILRPPVAFPEITLAQHWHARHNLDPERVWLRNLVNTVFKDQDPTTNL